MSSESKKQEKSAESQTEKEKKVVRSPKKKRFAYILPSGRGQMHVHATFNNTIISITDQEGNVICWSSAGKCGFRGPKKATPYAAGIIVKDIVEVAKERGVREVDVFLEGVGSGREAGVRAIALAGVQVMSIKDITPVPHNGVRAPKVRRV